MSGVELVASLVAALLGGGIFAGAATLYRARRTVPAERDSIVVGGAETAVLSLEKSLAAETRRADRAESAVRDRDAVIAAKEKRIEELERRLDTVQQMLDDVRDELHQIRTSVTGA